MRTPITAQNHEAKKRVQVLEFSDLTAGPLFSILFYVLVIKLIKDTISTRIKFQAKTILSIIIKTSKNNNLQKYHVSWYSIFMKINHRRKNPTNRNNLGYNWFNAGLLKHESNRDRRRWDRAVLALMVAGDDDMVFGTNHMGNPWHWD